MNHDQESFGFMYDNGMNEPHAVAKRGDPDTSWEAAESFTPQQLTHIQADVLAYFRKVKHATDEDMVKAMSAQYWNVAYSTLRTRRGELVDRGFLHDSGVRTINGKGKRIIVWSLS